MNEIKTQVERQYKIVLLGPAGVGKRSILYYLCRHRFDPQPCPTIGAAFMTYKKQIENITIRLNIWDLSGDNRFQSIIPLYIRDAEIIVIVYDLSDLHSKLQMESEWLPYVESRKHDYLASAPKYLIGNKTDLLDDKRILEDMSRFAERKGYEFWATSAKFGMGIVESFNAMVQNLVDNNILPREREKTVQIKPIPNKKSLTRCRC